MLLGIIGGVALTIQSANWIIYKTNSNLKKKLKSIIFKLYFVLLGLVIISLLVWHIFEPKPFQNFLKNPWLFISPIITFVELFGLLKLKPSQKMA